VIAVDEDEVDLPAPAPGRLVGGLPDDLDAILQAERGDMPAEDVDRVDRVVVVPGRLRVGIDA